VHQPDTLVLDHPTEVLDGRHRSAPSTGRRALTRTAVSAVAVLVVATAGWFTADAVGLTRTDTTAAADLPREYLRPQGDEPSPARAGHRSAAPAPETPPAPDAVDAGGPTAAVPARPPAVAVPPPTADRPRVPSVRVGDTCSAPGAVGVTAKGKPAVCTAGSGPTRWKNA
jgi:hypothetical protein